MWSCWRSSDPHLTLVRSSITSPPSASSSLPVSSLLFFWQFIYGGARLMCLSASVVSKDTHYKEKTNTHSRTEGGHLTSSQRAIWELLLVIRLNSALDVVTEESSSAAILLWGLKRVPFLGPPFPLGVTETLNWDLHSYIIWLVCGTFIIFAERPESGFI